MHLSHKPQDEVSDAAGTEGADVTLACEIVARFRAATDPLRVLPGLVMVTCARDAATVEHHGHVTTQGSAHDRMAWEAALDAARAALGNLPLPFGLTLVHQYSNARTERRIKVGRLEIIASIGRLPGIVARALRLERLAMPIIVESEEPDAAAWTAITSFVCRGQEHGLPYLGATADETATTAHAAMTRLAFVLGLDIRFKLARLIPPDEWTAGNAGAVLQDWRDAGLPTVFTTHSPP